MVGILNINYLVVLFNDQIVKDLDDFATLILGFYEQQNNRFPFMLN